jgi:8-oxo-dGTP pyrophosphatase MutT (NUDIX family)
MASEQLHHYVSEDDEIWRPHVTVATIVADGGRFLLVEEEVRGRVLFNQPAGHLDPGESLAQAAVRETLEETGWDVHLTALVVVQQWVNPLYGRHFVRFTFAAEPVRHHPERPLDAGILRPHWLRRAEVEALGERLRSPMILSSIDAWLGGQRLPLQALDSLLPTPTVAA